MLRKEEKQEPISRGELLVRALQSRIQERREMGEEPYTDTEIYILKDVPGRFGKD